VSSALPTLLPIFPLPASVLFPRMPMPLHVFEPRYRKMVRDALHGARLIGMTLLRPGWEDDYLGRPAIYPIGCAGELHRCEALADGRYNIVLRGVTRFRVLGEDTTEPYRVARVETLPDEIGDPEALAAARARLGEAVALAADGPAVLVVQPELPDEVFVNALCQTLPLESVEQQSLLDCGHVSERCERLLEILDFKRLEKKYGKARSDVLS
jgi:Lon protease-like protein